MIRWGAAAVCLAGMVAAMAQDQPLIRASESGDALATSAPADESPAEPLPPEIAGMKLDEHLGAAIPLDLEFTNQEGKKVKLREYFDGKRPVILNLQYYRCPMLCGLVLNALSGALKELDWTVGNEFRVLTVSFDPLETPDLARVKRQSYLRDYGRAPAAAGWDFLVGQSAPIKSLLDATGFPVRWNERRKEWIHVAALIVLTPDGRISRYLRGVYFEPQTVRLTLVEASEGKIGTTTDQLLLFCFHYDPRAGRYSVAALNVVRAGGVLTMLLLGTTLAVYFRRERRRRVAFPPAGAPER